MMRSHQSPLVASNATIAYVNAIEHVILSAPFALANFTEGSMRSYMTRLHY